MGLIDKIKKGAVALGLAGTMAFSGCETTPNQKTNNNDGFFSSDVNWNNNSGEDDELIGLVLEGVAPFSKDVRTGVALSSVGRSLATKRARQNVNVYINNQQLENKKSESLEENQQLDYRKRIASRPNEFFTYNSVNASKMNGNGIIDPEECIGYNKKQFYIKEDIRVRFFINNERRSSKFEFVLYGPENNEIERINDFISKGGYENVYTLKDNEKKPGRYFAEWKIHGESIGSLEFWIMDDKSGF